MKQRIKLVIEYDGGAYSGWQFQNGQVSVQEKIEQAFEVIFKKSIRVIAAGRTDAGVHARGQVVHTDIPEYDLFRLHGSLNGLLPPDIVIKEIEPCLSDFHARFDAKSRRYRYYLSKQPTAINRNLVWCIHFPVNLTLLQTGADEISKYQNFRAFCKIKSEVKHHRCDIQDSRWIIQDGLLVYEIAANRFLHGMVRAITGTLIDLGRGKISYSEFKNIIISEDRTRVLTTAPAKGLVLEHVVY